MFKAHPGCRPLLVSLPIRVNTYDIDVADHVNNGVYIRWLEDLRMEFLRVNYPLQRLLEDDLFPIVYSTNIVYHHPINLFDEPEGVMWCSQMGRATLTVEAEIKVDGRVTTTATQRGMLVRGKGSKRGRMPKELLDAFQAQNEVPA